MASAADLSWVGLGVDSAAVVECDVEVALAWLESIGHSVDVSDPQLLAYLRRQGCVMPFDIVEQLRSAQKK
jgi:hypothetical protein